MSNHKLASIETQIFNGQKALALLYPQKREKEVGGVCAQNVIR